MPQGREGRGQTSGGSMTLWTFTELMQMTRQELFELDHTLRAMLKRLKPGTAARTDPLASLENIRRVLVQRDLHL
jgi:hypothetical protein